jgi:hypothetical protein
VGDDDIDSPVAALALIAEVQQHLRKFYRVT